MDCDHHSHRVRGRLRCCKCSAEHIIAKGWAAGLGKPLRVTRCIEIACAS